MMRKLALVLVFGLLTIGLLTRAGMLGPQFAPSQRTFGLSGTLVPVNPAATAPIPPGDGENDADYSGN